MNQRFLVRFVFFWFLMLGGGCESKLGDIRPTMTSNGEGSVATSSPTLPSTILAPTPFVKPTLSPYVLPTYLLSYHKTEGISWISGEPGVIGVDTHSETVYMRTFGSKLVFLEGLFPTHFLDIDILTLRDRYLFQGKGNTLYIPSYYHTPSVYNKERGEYFVVTMIEDEKGVAKVTTPLKWVSEVYYEPQSDLWYITGTNDEDGIMVAYRGQELVKQWIFPGKKAGQIAGDGRGHVYIHLTRSVELTEKNEQGSMFQTLDSIATTIGTEEWHYVIEDHKRYLFFEADPVNHYIYHLERDSNRNPADGTWSEIWLMRDGKVVLKQELPHDIDGLDRVLPNPLTKEVYSSGPLFRNDEYYDGLFPVMTIENDKAVFHDPINLRVKEPYPHYIRWAFDEDQAILYGLDSDNQFVYVVRNNQYEGRFPIDCDHPYLIHVNSVTSLIYVTCNFEVRVFGYPELLSPKIQAQLSELERTAPDLLPKK